MDDHATEFHRLKENEPYMNKKQIAYFRKKLLVWRQNLLKETAHTVSKFIEDQEKLADEVECGMRAARHALDISILNRNQNLLKQIEAALIRIDDGSYGFCEETEEKIGLKRLEAFPVATLCLEAQKLRESKQKN